MRILSLILLPAWLWGQGVPAKQVTEWRERIAQVLFVPRPLPALEARRHGQFEPAQGVVAERVTYASQFGMRVPAIVYRPAKAVGRGPGLVVVNGHGGDKYSWYAYWSGVMYARAGAVVVTYDPAGEGERNAERKSGTRAHDKVEPPDELGRRVGGLMITDVQQAVSYLVSRPDVDPRRIGAFGYSMGSFILSLAGAVETRMKACVLVGGGNLDGPGEYWDKSKPMCQGLPYQALGFLSDRPAAIYTMHARRGPTLIYNGLADSTVQIPRFGEAGFRDLRERTVRMNGGEKGVFDTGFVPEVGHRPQFVTKPVALWLERHLDFPHWTEASIRAMPETHISEWAAKYSVPMDRLYAEEMREGGTPALGANVPGPSREALSVFTAAEWEKEKGRLIHESWLKEAKARIAGR